MFESGSGLQKIAEQGELRREFSRESAQSPPNRVNA
jgi:hypothetical protein